MGFQQGLSGLNAAAKNLDVIGNNVSNANTVGFKLSQAQFADVYANSLAGSGGTQVGIGVRVAEVAQQFTQGNITAMSSALLVVVMLPWVNCCATSATLTPMPTCVPPEPASELAYTSAN